MRGALASKIRTAVPLAVALAGAAAARAQPPTVSIEDVRVVEGSSGNWSLSLTVTLSSYPGSPVIVPWKTVDGSAIAGQDYVAGAASVTFSDATPRTFTVSIIGDSLNEWSPTLQMDEAFFVDLDPPTTGNADLLKGRATVTIVDDDRTSGVRPGLQLASAVADAHAGAGRVRLQWRWPPPSATSGPMMDVLVRWNEGPSCVAPTDTTGSVTGGQFYISGLGIPVGTPGDTQLVEHAPRPYDRHCYALFAMYPGPTPTTDLPAVVVATPPDPAGDAGRGAAVAWAYSAGGSLPSIVPPTVGGKAIYTVSNDGVVHSMERGETGGVWPPGWNPVSLGKAATLRSPVVPLPYGQRLFVGTQSGEVHAVNGENGAIAWSRSAAFKNSALANNGSVQGTPAGLFTSFTGLNDIILVGSYQGTSNNTFYILDPVTGADRATYSHGSMGGIAGMPTVDYTGNMVYFLTNAPTGTLWAFGLGPSGSPALNLVTSPVTYPVGFPAGTNGSPVLRNGRLYFGLANGDVVAYRLSNGQVSAVGLGALQVVNGFVFPDRRNTDVYFSTNSRVWGARDTAATSNPGLTLLPWVVTDIPSPSIVLHWPGTNFLYVGGGDGRLYQIDVASPDPQGTKKSVLLESNSQIGAPSLDGPNNLALVGSVSGVVYAVRVPLTLP